MRGNRLSSFAGLIGFALLTCGPQHAPQSPVRADPALPPPPPPVRSNPYAQNRSKRGQRRAAGKPGWQK